MTCTDVRDVSTAVRLLRDRGCRKLASRRQSVPEWRKIKAHLTVGNIAKDIHPALAETALRDEGSSSVGIDNKHMSGTCRHLRSGVSDEPHVERFDIASEDGKPETKLGGNDCGRGLT